MEKLIEVKNLSKIYGNKTILDNITFNIYKGEFLSILGSSGCGKTTLLRILAGIEKQTSGNIYKNNKNINNVTPFERKVSIVFQNYALFPNMNVYQNINYVLSPLHLEKEKRDKLVNNIIKNVGLSEHALKKPAMLSGGQQQRVAIARALITEPDLILFDEPMAALDSNIKHELRKQLKDLQKKYKITMVYITHDQEEAFALSDRIMVINNDHIVQLDKPTTIYKNPKNDFVKDFVKNQLDEKVESIMKSIK